MYQAIKAILTAFLDLLKDYSSPQLYQRVKEHNVKKNEGKSTLVSDEVANNPENVMAKKAKEKFKEKIGEQVEKVAKRTDFTKKSKLYSKFYQPRRAINIENAKQKGIKKYSRQAKKQTKKQAKNMLKVVNKTKNTLIKTVATGGSVYKIGSDLFKKSILNGIKYYPLELAITPQEIGVSKFELEFAKKTSFLFDVSEIIEKADISDKYCNGIENDVSKLVLEYYPDEFRLDGISTSVQQFVDIQIAKRIEAEAKKKCEGSFYYLQCEISSPDTICKCVMQKENEKKSSPLLDN